MAQTQSGISQNTICREPGLFQAMCEHGPAQKSRLKDLQQSILFLITWKAFHYFASRLKHTHLSQQPQLGEKTQT